MLKDGLRALNIEGYQTSIGKGAEVDRLTF